MGRMTKTLFPTTPNLLMPETIPLGIEKSQVKKRQRVQAKY